MISTGGASERRAGVPPVAAVAAALVMLITPRFSGATVLLSEDPLSLDSRWYCLLDIDIMAVFGESIEVVAF